MARFIAADDLQAIADADLRAIIGAEIAADVELGSGRGGRGGVGGFGRRIIRSGAAQAQAAGEDERQSRRQRRPRALKRAQVHSQVLVGSSALYISAFRGI
jgi:hypothetical protein